MNWNKEWQGRKWEGLKGHRKKHWKREGKRIPPQKHKAVQDNAFLLMVLIVCMVCVDKCMQISVEVSK